MKKLNDIPSSQNTELEGLTTHANAIHEMGIAEKGEIYKRMDALCIDENICRSVFGDEFYETIKDDIKTFKSFLDIENDEQIKSLPEYKEFVKNQKNENTRRLAINILKEDENIQKEIENTRRLAINILKENENIEKEDPKITLPKNLQKEKEELLTIERYIRKVISEKEEKNRGRKMFFSDIVKYNKQISLEEKNEIEKKITDFMKGDYILEKIREKIKKNWEKLNFKIFNFRKKKEEKNKQNQNQITEKDMIKNNINEEEMLKEFRKKINNIKSIKERFYLPEDRKDMEHIQEYFKKQRKKTISSPDLNIITTTNNQSSKNIMEKTNDNMIRMHNDDYNEMKRRELNFKKNFKNKIWNPKEYLFDRLIEYVGMDILEYEIKKHTKGENKKIKKYSIYKTDPLDDSFAGADYIVLYQFEGEKREKIAAIDLFVSDKKQKITEGEKKETPDPGSLEEKLEKAKNPKIPYSTYIKLFSESEQKRYEIKKLQRYVEQQHPILTYSLLKEIIKNKDMDIENFLEKLEEKSKLCDVFQKQKEGNQNVNKEIQQYFFKNIILDLEKVAA